MKSQLSLALISVGLLLCSPILIRSGDCSLAAYSETRSFRDALDGRSMEEALSGPVDRDTSSYGDRTSSNGQSSSGNSGSNNLAGSASPMMLSIPANGNLEGSMANQQQQQTVDSAGEQAKGGSELEREAGPINEEDQSSMQQPDQQQQVMMMEQKAARQQRNSPASRASSGRLIGGSRMSSARQQQAMEPSYSSKTNEPTTFGEDQSTKQPAKGGSEQSTTAGYGTNEDEQQQQQVPAGAGEQPQPQEAAGEEKGYAAGDMQQQQQVAAKQRAMAAMLMSMNNGMKYSRSSSAQMGGQPMMASAMNQYGDAQRSAKTRQAGAGMSTMAQSMMMSLANKAAYMGAQQKQEQQQQRMLMAMMLMNGSRQMGAQANGSSNGMNAGGSYAANSMNGRQQQQMQTPSTGGYAAMLGSMNAGYGGPRGALRRASQRKSEKKMSPAMMNAMLNKMLGARQEPAGAAGYSQMRQKAAEMMASMPAAKRDQYKRMMVAAALMQQNAISSEAMAAGQEQQPISGADSPSYGEKKAPEAGGSSTMSPTMSMLMANMMMAGQEKRQANGGYGGPMMEPMSGQEKSDSGEYNSQMMMQQAPMSAQMPMPMSMQMQVPMSMNAPAKVARSRSSNGGRSAQTGAYTPSPMAMPMQMQMQMPMQMPAAQMPMQMQMGSTKGAKSAYAGGQQQAGEEQQEDEEQQREMQSPVSTGAPSYASREMSAMEAPAVRPMSAMMAPAKTGKQMNGFRQAYQQMGGARRAAFGDKSANYGAQMGAGAERDYSEQTSSMQRPMAPQMSTPTPADAYGSGQQPERAQAGQEQQVSEQQQQQQDDSAAGYGGAEGAAPMGQAEPFAFDYKIEDDYGNGQYRKEESDKNGVVRGSYGYTDTSGLYRHVEYVADENGFRANIKSNEPGLSTEPKPAGSNGMQREQQQMADQMAPNSMAAQMAPSNQENPSSPGAIMTMAGGRAQMQSNQQQQQLYEAQAQSNENGEK